MPSPPRCFPAPPEFLPDAVAFDAHRILVLERFHRSVPAIGHVRMRGAVARRPSPTRPCRRRWFRSRQSASFAPSRVPPPKLKLFIVPQLAAGMRSGAAFASAPRITSVMRCDVSTLPAAIAAGGRAFTMLPSRSHDPDRPEDARRKRNLLAHQAAEHIHRRRRGHRQVRVHGTIHLRRRPVKSTTAVSPASVTATRTGKMRPFRVPSPSRNIFEAISPRAAARAASPASCARYNSASSRILRRDRRLAVLSRPDSRSRAVAAADRHQLRHQIAFALHRRAHIRQHQPQQRRDRSCPPLWISTGGIRSPS